MKTLVLLAHPNLADSKINSSWAQAAAEAEGVTVHDLYATYPDFAINVAAEQALLLEHDRIVFQFPFYWYSTPALLKEWQDKVLEYGFAYGSTGDKLQGKEFLAAFSTGGPEESYQAGGFNHFSFSELTKPLQAMANLTGMKFLPSFTSSGALTQGEADIEASSAAYTARLAEK